MSDLEIIDIYENSNKEKSKKFVDKVNSSLRIQTDTKREIKDIEWIEKMEETIPYLDNILRSPNRFIINEEEIVKIERARKITVDSIKHLSKNTNFIQSIDKKTGDVKPSKILNINKEESYDTYENRLIYTLIQNKDVGLSQIYSWFLWNGSLSAFGVLLAFGHPLSILTAFVMAPITSLNPLLAAGWFAGLTEAHIRKPKVKDFENLAEDTSTLKGFWHNRVTHILLVVIMANIFSTIGTFVSGVGIISSFINII